MENADTLKCVATDTVPQAYSFETITDINTDQLGFVVGMPSRNISNQSKCIDEFNKYYTTIVTGGKNLVIRANLDAFGNANIEFFNHKEFTDIHKDYNKVPIQIETTNGTVIKQFNPAKLWLESPESDSAKFGVTFYPKLTKFYKGKLNTYMGLGCTPIDIDEKAEIDLQLYLNHVYNVICDGNQEHGDYLIKWIAHAVQKPEEKPEVGVVLKAGQGTGKGTLLKPLSKIFGAHYLHATSPEQVIGKFNSQLENKIMIFADEFFAGSKGSTDRLKAMITETTGSIERKGIDRINLPDFSRIIMATNHENVISIERDERRYFYLEVSDRYKQNREYFKPLHETVNKDDFAGHLLSYLIGIDIADFEPRNVPKTKALEEQKIDNLDPLDKWLFEILSDGTFFGAGLMEVSVSRKDIQTMAQKWIDDHGLKVFGSLDRQLGKRLTILGVKVTQPRIEGKQVRHYIFPELAKVRHSFENYMAFTIDW